MKIKFEISLAQEDKPLTEGLKSGSLRRHGGAIRDKQSGLVVRHLLESPKTTIELSKAPTSRKLKGSTEFEIDMSKIVTGIPQDLSSLLGLSQIAAAASVINIGVSIAGFAYIGYKLNQLQDSVEELNKTTTQGFSKLEQQLERISSQLAYLLLLAEENASSQEILSDAISDIYKAQMMQYITELQAHCIQLQRWPEHSPREFMLCATRTRLHLKDQARRINRRLKISDLLYAEIANQGWAAATAIESLLLLKTHRTREAIELLRDESTCFRRDSAQFWADALLTDSRLQLSTAYRFAASKLTSYIHQNRLMRIANISNFDMNLNDEQIRERKRDAEIALDIYETPKSSQAWVYRQVAVAEYLDGLSELAARLDSMLAFAELHETSGLSNEKILQVFAEASDSPGIYAVRVLEDKGS